MSKQRKTVASTYLYDPLDRLAASNSIQRFYNDTRIATEIEGDRKSRFFETDSQPLALQQHGSLPGTTLLATDQQTSVLNGVSPEGALHAQAYSPFGHHPIGTSLNGAGFNGEQPEPLTGHYLLGQGYRAFNPVLMRFNSPDSWSPFGDGGINAYAYCDNDPLNKVDPTGHFPNIWKGLKNLFGRVPKKMRPTSAGATTVQRRKPGYTGVSRIPLGPKRPPGTSQSEAILSQATKRMKQPMQSIQETPISAQAMRNRQAAAVINKKLKKDPNFLSAVLQNIDTAPQNRKILPASEDAWKYHPNYPTPPSSTRSSITSTSSNSHLYDEITDFSWMNENIRTGAD